jgi:hypothetical protein
MGKRKKKMGHGGARAGSGRKAVLVGPVKVLVTLEDSQAKKLDGLCKRTGSNRSATMRGMIDQNIKEESDDGEREDSGRVEPGA